MNPSEFDKFAEEYLATHADNVRISGEEPEFFARSKIEEVRRRWTGLRRSEPETILDFGAGIGNSWPHFAALFPAAKLTGLDVSEKSLAIAERRFPGTATPLHYSGGEIPLPEQSFDLIFSACVFHHIPAQEHVGLFAQLRRLLRPDGRMVIFEHNPANPVTRYIVATCPFDENAVLISPRDLKARQGQAGFRKVSVAYTAFFPGALSALRPLERFMTGVPVGAQYYTLAGG